jgi:zinc/manganese transport system ATP-binding protein
VTPGQDEVVLTVDGVSVSLAGRPILHGVSFTLNPGTFCGLIGSNGSGKTTLLRTILGLVTPSAGRVTIAARVPTSVGYVPQKSILDAFLPIRARDLVALGLDGHRLGLPLPSRQRRQAVDEMLDAVGATGFADQRIGNLSGGQQQRILTAHALVRRPRLLLLDEPLANLDMGSVAGIVTLLRRLAREHRVAILLTGHDMNPLLPAMDRIVYLANGRAVSGATSEVIRTEVLSALYGYHIDVIRVHGRILVIAADASGGIMAETEKFPEHATAVP